MFSQILNDESDTEQLAQQLAQQLRGGDVVYLIGDLGAGKTTLCRYLLRALGVEGRIKSPTYTLVEQYDLSPLVAKRVAAQGVHHFDLYRLEDPREWYAAGFDELVSAEYIVLVEWAEKAAGAMPAPTWTVALTHSACLTRREVVWGRVVEER